MKAIHMYIKSGALELLFPNGPVIMWLSARSQARGERYWSALKLIFFIRVSNEQKVLESGVAAPESSQHPRTHVPMHKYGLLKPNGWPETFPRHHRYSGGVGRCFNVCQLRPAFLLLKNILDCVSTLSPLLFCPIRDFDAVFGEEKKGSAAFS